jgi:hypothetical protein
MALPAGSRYFGKPPPEEGWVPWQLLGFGLGAVIISMLFVRVVKPRLRR